MIDVQVCVNLLLSVGVIFSGLALWNVENRLQKLEGISKKKNRRFRNG